MVAQRGDLEQSHLGATGEDGSPGTTRLAGRPREALPKPESVTGRFKPEGEAGPQTHVGLCPPGGTRGEATVWGPILAGLYHSATVVLLGEAGLTGRSRGLTSVLERLPSGVSHVGSPLDTGDLSRGGGAPESCRRGHPLAFWKPAFPAISSHPLLRTGAAGTPPPSRCPQTLHSGPRSTPRVCRGTGASLMPVAPLQMGPRRDPKRRQEWGCRIPGASGCRPWGPASLTLSWRR